MPDNNTKNLKILGDNWADDLLIKEESGQLHAYKNQILAPAAKLNNLAAKIAAPAPVPTDDKFLALLPIGKSTAKANFGFHPEDEEEIKNIIKELPKDLSRKYSIEKIVEKLIVQEKLKFTPQIQKQFIDILLDFFRNRRNAIILRELMSTRILSDNKILTEDKVNNIVSVVKTIKAKIDGVGGLVVKMSELKKQQPKEEFFSEGEVASSLNQPAVADIEAEINTKIKKQLVDNKDTQKEVEDILAVLPQVEKSAVKPEAKPPAAPQAEKIADKPNLEKPATIKPTPLPRSENIIKESLPKVMRPGITAGSKKAVTDVLQQPKKIVQPPIIKPASSKSVLTGPIEELQNLSLENFRRLGNSAAAQSDKLLSKINLLEKDSVTRKAQGIEAWRNSEIYNLYLSLGEESLSQDKEVAAVIKQRQAANQPTLTLEEFSTISDLNKKLRF